MGLFVILLFISAALLVEAFPTGLEPDDLEFFIESVSEYLTTDDRNFIRALYAQLLSRLGLLLNSNSQDDKKSGLDRTEFLYNIIDSIITDDDRNVILTFSMELLTRLKEKSDRTASLKLIDIENVFSSNNALGIDSDKMEMLFEAVNQLLTDDDRNFIHNLYTDLLNRLEKEGAQIESTPLQGSSEDTMLIKT